MMDSMINSSHELDVDVSKGMAESIQKFKNQDFQTMEV